MDDRHREGCGRTERRVMPLSPNEGLSLIQELRGLLQHDSESFLALSIKIWPPQNDQCGKDGQHHNCKSPSRPPQVQYDGCIFSQRYCYIQKPCAVGNSNGTKRYSFNILNIYIGSDEKHSPYIYITEHQSTPTRTATQIQVRTRRHTNT